MNITVAARHPAQMTDVTRLFRSLRGFERNRDFATVMPSSLGLSMSISGCIPGVGVALAKPSPSWSFPRPAKTACQSKRDHQLQEVKHEALKFVRPIHCFSQSGCAARIDRS